MKTLTKAQQRGWDRGAHTPPWLWLDGKQYFSIRYLALEWGVPRGVATRWAKARPHLTTLRDGRYLFCRNDSGHPTTGVPNKPRPDRIECDGLTYFTMPALAKRRGITPHGARAWAKSRPHLTLTHRNHLYCRDDEFNPGSPVPRSIERNGKVYWSILETSRRHGVDVRTVRRWAARHPDRTITDAGHLFLENPQFGARRRAAPVIEHEGQTYYSLAELARRRGTSHQAVRQWLRNHPHLGHHEGRYLYSRDEEYTPRRPTKPTPDLAIILKTRAARRPRP